ncbi:MAG TPA: DNA repair exonuclease [bacterium]|jgi:DNA repair exonuclease SbcCD nuclease subunit
MIRLLHVADVHLGKTFKMLGRRGAEQRRALQAAFERTVGMAIERQVQAVLIAGDLFDTPKPSDPSVRFVAGQLRALDDAGIASVLIAGNHDLGGDGRVGAAEQLSGASSRLQLVGGEPELYRLPEHDLTIVARSALPGQSHPLSGWPDYRPSRFVVGVAHGSTFRSGQVEGPHVIHPQDIKNLQLDYLALGDWHSAFEILPPPAAAWYAGAPEWLGFDQPGSGQVLLIEIEEAGAARVTPVQIGQRRSMRREFDAAQVDEPALRAALAADADAELVYEAILTGLMPLHRTVNAEALEQEFTDRFFRLRITNKSRVWLDEAALEAFSTQTVLGQFVHLMRERITAASDAERPVLEEALQVGAAVVSGRREVLV